MHRKQQTSVKGMIEVIMRSWGRGRANQAVCVQAERQMVFYNGILTAPGKEMERQTDHAIKSTSLKCALFCE